MGTSYGQLRRSRCALLRSLTVSKTSLHTKASSGKVVNMLIPNANRAILTIVSFSGKLLSMFPNVFSSNVQYPATLIAVRAAQAIAVE